jgi:hypothetical protein
MTAVRPSLAANSSRWSSVSARTVYRCGRRRKTVRWSGAPLHRRGGVGHCEPSHARPTSLDGVMCWSTRRSKWLPVANRVSFLLEQTIHRDLLVSVSSSCRCRRGWAPWAADLFAQDRGASAFASSAIAARGSPRPRRCDLAARRARRCENCFRQEFELSERR